jgi:hypothetical protein
MYVKQNQLQMADIYIYIIIKCQDYLRLPSGYQL